MSRTTKVATAGAGVVAAVLIAWAAFSGTTTVDGPESAAQSAQAAPVVVPVAHVEDSFEATYRLSELGMEITDRSGQVVQAAQLETSTYRIVYRSARDWEIHAIDRQTAQVYRGDSLQFWHGGELQDEQVVPTQGVPVRQVMPLAVEEFHRHVADRGFTRADRSSRNGRTQERYEREVPVPEGEFYRTLPWKPEGNTEQVDIDFDERTGRIMSYSEALNDHVTFAFELLDTDV